MPYQIVQRLIILVLRIVVQAHLEQLIINSRLGFSERAYVFCLFIYFFIFFNI